MWIFRLMAVIGAMVCLGSCINFRGQSLTYRYDRESDTLRIFNVYEAIYNKDGGHPSDMEKAQLNSVVHGRRAFFFDNWIVEFNGEAIKELIENSRKTLAETDTPKQIKQLKADIEFWKEIDKAVHVQNGRFYLNQDGQLCGWQYVTMSNVSRLVPQINKMISRTAEIDIDNLGERAQQRLRDFTQQGEWVRVDGNQIRVRFVTPYDEFAKGSMEQDEEGKPFDLKTQDAVLNYDEPIAEVIFGRLDQETTTLARPSGDKGTSKVLIEYVKKNFGLVPMPNLEKLRKEFIRSGKAPENHRP